MDKTKQLGKKGVTMVQEKCTDKILRIANIVCCLIFVIVGIFRLMYAFSSEGFNFFFMISTFYYWAFVIIMGISEVPDTVTFKPKVLVTTYFNFMDYEIGKGFFMIFLILMMCENEKASVIVAVIVCGCIAACNFIIGWTKRNEKKPLPSQPWAAGAGGQAAGGVG